MNQCDLFGEPLPTPDLEDTVGATVSPLAAPCGFRNRSNKPCQRLAWDPIRLDGRKLRSHGRLLLHCPIDCFNGTPDEETPNLAEAAE